MDIPHRSFPKEALNLSEINPSAPSPRPPLLDETVAVLRTADPCEELPLTGRHLCRNLLAIGGVGSGKTSSIIFPLLRQTIEFQAGDTERKCGLFIIDSKLDGTAERVKQWAKDCGREADIREIGADDGWGYDPFTGVDSFIDIERLTEKMCCCYSDLSAENAYWRETATMILNGVLKVAYVIYRRFDLWPTINLLGDIFNNSPSDGFRESITRISRIVNSLEDPEEQKVGSMIAAAIRAVEVYFRLDTRTRGILQSILLGIIRPLSSLEVSRYYPRPGLSSVDLREVVDQGRILVIRAPAHEPGVVETMGRMIKCDLYGLIRSRTHSPGKDDRLFGMFFDEYPLVATGSSPLFGDVQALQTMREKRGFIVAATQGLVSMRNAVGGRIWEALALNFTSKVFLASQEPEVEDFARTVIGTEDQGGPTIGGGKKITPVGERNDESNTLLDHETVFSRDVENIIQPGDIARLEEHTGYFYLASGMRSAGPVFFVPEFSDYQPVLQSTHMESLADSVVELLHESVKPKHSPSGVDEANEQTKESEKEVKPDTKPHQAAHTTHSLAWAWTSKAPPIEDYLAANQTPSEICFPFYRNVTPNWIGLAFLTDVNRGSQGLCDDLSPGRRVPHILKLLKSSVKTRELALKLPSTRRMIYNALEATERFLQTCQPYWHKALVRPSKRPSCVRARRVLTNAAHAWLEQLGLPVKQLALWQKREGFKNTCDADVVLKQLLNTHSCFSEIPQEFISPQFIEFLKAWNDCNSTIKARAPIICWLNGIPVVYSLDLETSRKFAPLSLATTLSALTSIYKVPSLL